MRYELLYPSLYLKAVELMGKDVTMTIREVRREELVMSGGRREKKAVMYFEETRRKAMDKGGDEKRMVLNKTNAITIASLYGNETDDWIGKRITLFSDKAQFGSKKVDAIRIRDRVPPDPSPVQDSGHENG